MSNQGNIRIQAIIKDEHDRDEIVQCLKEELSEESVRIEVKDLDEGPSQGRKVDKRALRQYLLQDKETKVTLVLLGAVILGFFGYYTLRIQTNDPTLFMAFVGSLAVGFSFLTYFFIKIRSSKKSSTDASLNQQRKLYISVQCHRKVKNKVIELIEQGNVESMHIN